MGFADAQPILRFSWADDAFVRAYEGRTLRENLDLPRPKNRFFEN